jgi:hypothetical protein
MSAFTVACPCEAVKLTVDGEPIVCVYCHCDDCQAVHGAAYLPAALYRFEQTRLVEGVPGIWRRKVTARAFCRDCGTRMFAQPPGQTIRSFPAHLLPAGVFVPTCHINCRFAVMPVRDDLPHYAGFPQILGGSDERVAW